MSTPVFHAFPSSDELARTLANDVGSRLQSGISVNGSASIVVSGGSTPLRFFSELSQYDLDWSSVQVLLADERWVHSDDERSNAALVLRELLCNRAEKARFKPLFSEHTSVEGAAQELAVALSEMRKPFDAVILGMGGDGHTASLFQDAPELDAALGDNANAAMVLTPASQPERRVSLTPRVLTNTEFLVLHIEGAEKRKVFELALQDGKQTDLPVRAILRNDIRQTQVYWCP